MSSPSHQIGELQPRSAELVVEPDTEVVQRHPRRQSGTQTVDLMGTLPPETEGVEELVKNRLDDLTYPGNPPPKTLGPASLFGVSLPAAVEVACYRITQEALTNVVRHAGARSCSVLLALEQEARTVRVEITDDGRGLSSERKGVGVGLSSMRERAEELGGTCRIDSLPGSGTRVSARLPCQLPNTAQPKGE